MASGITQSFQFGNCIKLTQKGVQCRNPRLRGYSLCARHIELNRDLRICTCGHVAYVHLSEIGPCDPPATAVFRFERENAKPCNEKCQRFTESLESTLERLNIVSTDWDYAWVDYEKLEEYIQRRIKEAKLDRSH